MMSTSPKKHPTTALSRLKGLGKKALVASLGCLFLLGGLAPLAAAPPAEITSLVQEGSFLLLDPQGQEVLAFQADLPLVPASIVKIATSQLALDYLGEGFRFSTHFLTDRAGNLLIRGWGDPFLVSEEIRLIAAALKQKGLSRIKAIHLDAGSFGTQGIQIPGTTDSLNPYDALNGALVVNFNSLALQKTKQGELRSAEAPTPLTPLAIEKGKLLKPGEADRINLTRNPTESLRYVGELFAQMFQEVDIKVEDPQIQIQPGPGPWQLLYEHQSSRPLPQILQGLLRFSNNFIANQIFLVMGAKEFGYPASLDKSRRLFARLVQQTYGLDQRQIFLFEASGISRENRASARAMGKILERFKEHAGLLHAKRGVPLKSGTLTGAYNYAGYFKTKAGLYPFVILLNQEQNKRDQILALLQARAKP